jgi:uncharacterized protein (UPF0335 family)
METEIEIEQQRQRGPVTLGDVIVAIGDGDPRTTYAGAVRKILGRGSLSTIQRHLMTLRQQMDAEDQISGEVVEVVLPAVPGGIEEMSKTLVQKTWELSYRTVQSTLQAQLLSAAQKIERLEAEIDAARSDVASMLDDLEAAEQRAEAADKRARIAERERDEALNMLYLVREIHEKVDHLAHGVGQAS